MKSIYIFSGTEVAVRDIYLNQIAKVGNYEIKWIDDILDIIQSGRKKSMLQKQTLFILSECSDLVKNEKSWKLFDIGVGKNMLVCMFTSLDKRVKFYKQYKDIIVEFEPLQPEILKKYIKKQIDLSDKNCETLMEICEGDYGRCLLEIDKINQYAKNDNASYEPHKECYPDYCFRTLLKDGAIYKPPKDAIFDFVDSVLRRDAYNCFRLMQESYDSGEATLVMIANLYNNFKALLQVQSCKSRDISNCTGLTGWQISNAVRYKGNYTTGELVDVLLKIRNAEVGIKSGTVDEMIAVPQLLVNIL
jgi:DNA polymerase III delta subunit